MKVFLTGATGFVGRHLAIRLARDGHTVRCLVRSPAKALWMDEHPLLVKITGDIDDEASIRRGAEDADIVFHLAGCTIAVNEDDFLRVNGEGTGRLARAVAASARPAARIVHVSSLAVAGPRTSSHPASEDEPPEPFSAYGRSKLLGEALLKEHCGEGS